MNMQKIMKSLLFLTLSVHLASAATHSLQYLYTAVTPGISFPEFSVVGLVDGEQIVYYDSNIRKMIPKTGWIKEVEDEDYWNKETQISQRHEENFRTSVDNLKQRLNQSEGVHTVQWMYGCELDDNGTKSGYDQYGNDGEDFISLDLNTLTWTAANAKAVITKERWDSEAWAPQMKNYLDNDCINLLEKYTGDGRSTVERKVPPEASLFQKDSSSPVVCHATGFFPKAVMISWQKNGEDLHEEVELRETLPNQNGTFQRRSVLTVSPEELNKHSYTCIIQHSSLEKEMVLQVSDRRVLQGEVSYGSAAVIIISAPVVLILFLWITKERSEPSDESLLTKVILSPVDYESTEPSDESLLTKVIFSPVDYESTEMK
ncbi:H-2 class I histocompatibility antigen, Q9 alpha chain-like [Colossoma macropomum]|uniref:H-2 class I histocompatibility antigen, Q9 alpha chain-like n=1 Tax=Colossoma macropomum TaxID=42526 RepID=UPI001864DEAD|nr:H-2 class I histocompatibility antigen, Q9 alpha chain-like [Colossoma macropomum]